MINIVKIIIYCRCKRLEVEEILKLFKPKNNENIETNCKRPLETELILAQALQLKCQSLAHQILFSSFFVEKFKV